MFWKWKGEWKPRGKIGERVYAVGDIHGSLQETRALMAKIKTDDAYRDESDTYVIFLGDLIDRGPDSRGVIDYLIHFPYEFAKPLFIMGNHEEMLVRGLTGEPQFLPGWLKHGGFSCAESYGVSREYLLGRDSVVLEQILRSAIPREHIEFLASFLDYIEFGDFLFTHAGIRPGVPLRHQVSRELRWIREPFLSFKGRHGMMVVHGHTVVENVEVKKNRIALDTGAYQTGRLSAICVEDDAISFLDNE